MKIRLREKLLLPVIFTFITGMTIAISYLYINSTNAIKYEVQKSIENDIRLSVKFIGVWLQARITDVQTWSTQPIYQEALTETGETSNSVKKRAAQNLFNLEKGYPYYDFIFIADLNGDVVSSSPSLDSRSLNISDRHYFRQSIKGATWISEVVTSRKTANKVFVISVPVKYKGNIVGVLAGTIDLSEFSFLFLDSINPGKEGFVLLAEKSGEIFTGSTKGFPFKHIDEFEFGEKILAGDEGMSLFKTDKGTKIICFQKVDKTGWLFAEAKSLDSVLAKLVYVRNNSIILNCIVLLIVIFVVSELFKRIVQTPLRQTLKVISQVRKGNLNNQIYVGKKSDEIGIFIKAFNSMVAMLKETLENLESEVEERKNAEYKLEQHRDNLEELVNERTLALQKEHNERKQLEARLHLAEKMEAIGTLAGGVAHDLNNILSGILSYPELILMDLPEDSPLRPQIQTIHNSGKKAAAIVQDLLTLARRGVSVIAISNINKLVNEYIESPEYCKMISFYPDVIVQKDLGDALMNTCCSPVHLSKTIMNLVSNAAESMPNGGMLKITTMNIYIDTPLKGYEQVKEGEYIRLIVSDNGIGIAKKDLSRVYEPFYTKKQMGRSGTGLGMSVVWTTVKDCKGYIVCESAEGFGTSFTLYFPASRLKLEDYKTETFGYEYLGKGEKVLIIDDIQEQRQIASEILERLAYDVASVSSGEEAIEYLKENSADILILDMVMEPGMDGFETYKNIVKINPGQKAIIASGFSNTENIKNTLKFGAGQHITKPYSIDIIAKAVKEELMK